jgi:hypothetical protein
MKTLILLSVLCIGSSAFADLPTGSFSGYANSSAFNEFCRVDSADVEFTAGNNGSYSLNWEEHGMRTTMGSGFCDNYFDASLTPTSTPNQWDVSFNFNNDLIFGKAVMTGNKIEITANYSGMNTGASNLRATFTVNEQTNSMDYRRSIESNFGPSRIATGSLRR